MDRKTLQVAGVVAFYMFAALTVCSLFFFCSRVPITDLAP